MKKHIEILSLEHKGYTVMYQIDYDLGKVSLVERNRDRFDDKRFIFANRGLEYMNGWLDIIEAMRLAVVEGKKALESNLAEKSKFTEEMIMTLTKDKYKK